MTKKKITVCFFGSYDRTFTSNKIVLNGLGEAGADVFEVNANVAVTNLDKKGQLTPFELVKRVLKKAGLIKEIYKNWGKIKNCDGVYVGYPGHFDVIPAFIICKLLGKKLYFNPLIIFYTGFVEEQAIISKDSVFAKVIKFGEKIVYQMCDVVLADTPNQKEFLIKLFDIKPEKIKILPIGSDEKTYRYHTIKNNKSKKITILYYGLYSPVHGVEHIVDAAIAFKNSKDVSFVMIGQGNTFEKTVRRVQEEKLKNMKFIHDIPSEEQVKYTYDGDIFVGFLGDHPVVDRVIPNKVYQGLALGKAVVTAKSKLVTTVFKDRENIYCVDRGSSESFIAAIKELQNNPTLRIKIGENGYQEFLEKYSSKGVGTILKNYITENL